MFCWKNISYQLLDQMFLTEKVNWCRGFLLMAGWLVNNELDGFRKKLSWPNWGIPHFIKGLRKDTKDHRIVSVLSEILNYNPNTSQKLYLMNQLVWFLPWRWNQYVPLRSRQLCTRVDGVTSQMTVTLCNIALAFGLKDRHNHLIPVEMIRVDYLMTQAVLRL